MDSDTQRLAKVQGNALVRQQNVVRNIQARQNSISARRTIVNATRKATINATARAAVNAALREQAITPPPARLLSLDYKVVDEQRQAAVQQKLANVKQESDTGFLADQQATFAAGRADIQNRIAGERAALQDQIHTLALDALQTTLDADRGSSLSNMMEAAPQAAIGFTLQAPYTAARIRLQKTLDDVTTNLNKQVAAASSLTTARNSEIVNQATVDRLRQAAMTQRGLDILAAGDAETRLKALTDPTTGTLTVTRQRWSEVSSAYNGPNGPKVRSGTLDTQRRDSARLIGSIDKTKYKVLSTAAGNKLIGPNGFTTKRTGAQTSLDARTRPPFSIYRSSAESARTRAQGYETNKSDARTTYLQDLGRTLGQRASAIPTANSKLGFAMDRNGEAYNDYDSKQKTALRIAGERNGISIQKGSVGGRRPGAASDEESARGPKDRDFLSKEAFRKQLYDPGGLMGKAATDGPAVGAAKNAADNATPTKPDEGPANREYDITHTDIPNTTRILDPARSRRSDLDLELNRPVTGLRAKLSGANTNIDSLKTPISTEEKLGPNLTGQQTTTDEKIVQPNRKLQADKETQRDDMLDQRDGRARQRDYAKAIIVFRERILSGISDKTAAEFLGRGARGTALDGQIGGLRTTSSTTMRTNMESAATDLFHSGAIKITRTGDTGLTKALEGKGQDLDAAISLRDTNIKPVVGRLPGEQEAIFVLKNGNGTPGNRGEVGRRADLIREAGDAETNAGNAVKGLETNADTPTGNLGKTRVTLKIYTDAAPGLNTTRVTTENELLTTDRSQYKILSENSGGNATTYHTAATGIGGEGGRLAALGRANGYATTRGIAEGNAKGYVAAKSQAEATYREDIGTTFGDKSAAIASVGGKLHDADTSNAGAYTDFTTKTGTANRVSGEVGPATTARAAAGSKIQPASEAEAAARTTRDTESTDTGNLKTDLDGKVGSESGTRTAAEGAYSDAEAVRPVMDSSNGPATTRHGEIPGDMGAISPKLSSAEAVRQRLAETELPGLKSARDTTDTAIEGLVGPNGKIPTEEGVLAGLGGRRHGEELGWDGNDGAARDRASQRDNMQTTMQGTAIKEGLAGILRDSNQRLIDLDAQQQESIQFGLSGSKTLIDGKINGTRTNATRDMKTAAETTAYNMEISRQKNEARVGDTLTRDGPTGLAAKLDTEIGKLPELNATLARLPGEQATVDGLRITEDGTRTGLIREAGDAQQKCGDALTNLRDTNTKLNGDDGARKGLEGVQKTAGTLDTARQMIEGDLATVDPQTWKQKSETAGGSAGIFKGGKDGAETMRSGKDGQRIRHAQEAADAATRAGNLQTAKSEAADTYGKTMGDATGRTGDALASVGGKLHDADTSNADAYTDFTTKTGTANRVSDEVGPATTARAAAGSKIQPASDAEAAARATRDTESTDTGNLKTDLDGKIGSEPGTRTAAEGAYSDAEAVRPVMDSSNGPATTRHGEIPGDMGAISPKLSDAEAVRRRLAETELPGLKSARDTADTAIDGLVGPNGKIPTEEGVLAGFQGRLPGEGSAKTGNQNTANGKAGDRDGVKLALDRNSYMDGAAKAVVDARQHLLDSLTKGTGDPIDPKGRGNRVSAYDAIVGTLRAVLGGSVKSDMESASRDHTIASGKNTKQGTDGTALAKLGQDLETNGKAASDLADDIARLGREQTAADNGRIAEGGAKSGLKKEAGDAQQKCGDALDNLRDTNTKLNGDDGARKKLEGVQKTAGTLDTARQTIEGNPIDRMNSDADGWRKASIQRGDNATIAHTGRTTAETQRSGREGQRLRLMKEAETARTNLEGMIRAKEEAKGKYDADLTRGLGDIDLRNAYDRWQKAEQAKQDAFRKWGDKRTQREANEDAQRNLDLAMRSKDLAGPRREESTAKGEIGKIQDKPPNEPVKPEEPTKPTKPDIPSRKEFGDTKPYDPHGDLGKLQKLNSENNQKLDDTKKKIGEEEDKIKNDTTRKNDDEPPKRDENAKEAELRQRLRNMVRSIIGGLLSLLFNFLVGLLFNFLFTTTSSKGTTTTLPETTTTRPCIPSGATGPLSASGPSGSMILYFCPPGTGADGYWKGRRQGKIDGMRKGILDGEAFILTLFGVSPDDSRDLEKLRARLRLLDASLRDSIETLQSQLSGIGLSEFCTTLDGDMKKVGVKLSDIYPDCNGSVQAGGARCGRGRGRRSSSRGRGQTGGAIDVSALPDDIDPELPTTTAPPAIAPSGATDASDDTTAPDESDMDAEGPREGESYDDGYNRGYFEVYRKFYDRGYIYGKRLMIERLRLALESIPIGDLPPFASGESGAGGTGGPGWLVPGLVAAGILGAYFLPRGTPPGKGLVTFDVKREMQPRDRTLSEFIVQHQFGGAGAGAPRRPYPSIDPVQATSLAQKRFALAQKRGRTYLKNRDLLSKIKDKTIGLIQAGHLQPKTRPAPIPA